MRLRVEPKAAIALVRDLRCASRIVLELATGLPAEPDGLREGLSDLAWEEWLPAETSWAVRAHGRSPALRHTGYAAMLVKDAVRDRHRSRGRPCPPIDPDSPRLLLDLSVGRHGAAVGLDLAGRTLHRRGADRRGRAPIREDVAAGLAWLAGARGDVPIVDPFCGSGTLIAEAVAVARRIPAGRPLRATPLSRIPVFGAALADAAATADVVEGSAPAPAEARASDASRAAVDDTRSLLARLKLDDAVRVRHAQIETLDPALWGPNGLVLSNPPWGLRLDAETSARAWRSLGTLARRLPGWTLALVSGNPELTRHLGLRASRRHAFRTGGVDARLLVYEMRRRSG